MERTLFLVNRPIFSFSWDTSGDFFLTKIHEANQQFWPFQLQTDQSPEVCKEWLGNRITPVGRKLLSRIAEASKYAGVLGSLIVTKGLSLNDAYWIGQEGDSFDSVNLYENPFSEEIARLAFSKDSARAAAFLERSPEYASSGAMRKCWVRKNNGLFLMKADDWENTGGFNQVVAEYFASCAAEAFGISHVPYTLKLHERSDSLTHEPVCLCPLFTSINTGFVPAGILFKSQGISDRHLLTTWLESPKEHERLMKVFDREFYEDMQVFDSLIGNEDRHFNNFGYLTDNSTNHLIKPAPLFDHGLSLLSSVIGRENMSLEQCSSLSNRGTFLTFDEQAAYFVRPRHLEAIKNVMNTEFIQHPDVQIHEYALDRINEFMKFRCKIALDIAQNILEQKEKKHKIRR